MKWISSYFFFWLSSVRPDNPGGPGGPGGPAGPGAPGMPTAVEPAAKCM